jgi:hypothetical protein
MALYSRKRPRAGEFMAICRSAGSPGRWPTRQGCFGADRLTPVLALVENSPRDDGPELCSRQRLE